MLEEVAETREEIGVGDRAGSFKWCDELVVTERAEGDCKGQSRYEGLGEEGCESCKRKTNKKWTERLREARQQTDNGRFCVDSQRETGRQRETENRLRLTTDVFVWTVRHEDRERPRTDSNNGRFCVDSQTGRQTENKQTMDVSVSRDWNKQLDVCVMRGRQKENRQTER